MEKERKPKETAAIRAKLDSFVALQRKIDNQIERLEALNSSMYAPSAPNLTGMPGAPHDGASKTERMYEKKTELEAKIRRLTEKEGRLRKELEQLIEKMDDPDEQTVIEMRYLDRAEWDQITSVLFGDRCDYVDRYDIYLNRSYKKHGHALQTLARLYNAQHPE